jgi:diguanylate cyclase (GGDEF)-like protein
MDRMGRLAVQQSAPVGPLPRPVSDGTDGPLASSALSVFLISPRPAAGAELLALVRAALPVESVLTSSTVTDALARVGAERMRGREPAIFMFDFRGAEVRDLAMQVQQVRKAHPAAELLIVAEARESAAFAACVQLTGAPDKLTFLLAPLHLDHAIASVCTIADRFRLIADARRAANDGASAVSALEFQVQELRTRLDIAKHAARHDDLTGVLNRAGFVDELTTRLARDRQNQNVLMIDLDRFKAVNDTLGHGAGDELVRKICTGMSAIIPPGSVLARLGGDEFGVLVEALTDEGLHNLCTQMLKTCAQSRMISGHEVQVSASIGVARQGSIQSEVELMRQSDLALYAAKREGRNRYRVFDTALDKVTRYRLSIEGGLERALRSGQFTMAYQPIVTASTGKILGLEALVRWESPEHGSISPAEFIPIAEETGLILDIGDWIARQALKECRRWNGPYVSINLSARQFLRHNVAERILRYAAEADVSPRRIQIELTETAIIDDVERADRNLSVLREAGVRVALDDFGTGYSSLVYLNQFAIDCIKIDKSFVDNITRDHQSAMIVASVSKLAGSLGMSVVAEGVETEDQRRILMACGCGALQGYHFGKPMSAREVTALLASSAPSTPGD